VTETWTSVRDLTDAKLEPNNASIRVNWGFVAAWTWVAVVWIANAAITFLLFAA
jgi:hypothetical protein